ncbi:hypothetical protein ALQ95_200196 [Pseudomonas syringae pv. ribicola]|uniref:Uncharacterized protein n=1 Tax=Pseudomonas syringae pv. ribicola TaxID=55398 RepID=A0A3M2VSP2_PSESI|nr:hypothetical protein ALQ95_200196 [Pseudomonas syringae pv. ribicola]
MEWFKLLCRFWRLVCLCAKAIGMVRAFAWLYAWLPRLLDRFDTDDQF